MSKQTEMVHRAWEISQGFLEHVAFGLGLETMQLWVGRWDGETGILSERTGHWAKVQRRDHECSIKRNHSWPHWMEQNRSWDSRLRSCHRRSSRPDEKVILYSVVQIWISSWYHFLSAWRASFNISCSVDLLLGIACSFQMSTNIFMIPSLLRNMFTEYRILG